MIYGKTFASSGGYVDEFEETGWSRQVKHDDGRHSHYEMVPAPPVDRAAQVRTLMAGYPDGVRLTPVLSLVDFKTVAPMVAPRRVKASR